jgi:hypothetical protein
MKWPSTKGVVTRKPQVKLIEQRRMDQGMNACFDQSSGHLLIDVDNRAGADHPSRTFRQPWQVWSR